MAHFEEVIKKLLNDAQEIAFESVADRFKALYDHQNDTLAFKLLSKDYLLTREGLYRNEKPAEELVSLLILNALFCPGDNNISNEFKPYRSFSGTGGHLKFFTLKIEGLLAQNYQIVAQKKGRILKKLDGHIYQGETTASVAIEFEPFANIKILCLLYEPDEEFTATAKILFSSNADKFMPPLCLEKLALLLIQEILSTK